RHVARRARRADPRARPGRGLRDRRSDRARAPGVGRRRTGSAALQDPACGGDLPGPLQLRGVGRLLRRAEPRPAARAQRALLLAARGVRLPEAEQHHRGLPCRCADARPHRRHARARRRPVGTCTKRRTATGIREAGIRLNISRAMTGPSPFPSPRLRGEGSATSADLVARVVRPEIRAQSAYVVAKAEGMVKLDAMENPYTLPGPVRARLDAALSHVAV